MTLDEIAINTKRTLEFMLGKAQEEQDNGRELLASTWRTMAQGVLFLWQELLDADTTTSDQHKFILSLKINQLNILKE